MTRLGAILAGSKSTRFDSHKAEAMLDGQPFIINHPEDLTELEDRNGI